MKKIFVLLALLPTAASFAQTANPAMDGMLKSLLSHTVPTLNCNAVDSMTGAVLLDARERTEFDISHVRGARWVGYKDFRLTRVSDIDRSRPVIVYCSVGYRSEKIAEELRRAGFHYVFNLFGGIFDWINRGLPVVDSVGFTSKIHAYDRTWGVWLNRGEKIYDD